MRSAYLWCVLDRSPLAFEPLALFTVKHELVDWLKRNGHDSGSVRVLHWRGYAQTFVDLDVDELVA